MGHWASKPRRQSIHRKSRTVRALISNNSSSGESNNNNNIICGIKDVTESIPVATSEYVGKTSGSYGYSATARKYNSASYSSYGATYTTGDVIGVALDMDAGTLTFYKNGTSQGVAYTGLSGTFAPAFSMNQSSQISVNFGQRPFAYTPPTGHLKLNTFNLPDSSITDGSQYMNPVLYTGDGVNGRSITGVGFNPNFLWIKDRSSANRHSLHDIIRGAGKRLISDGTDAESSTGSHPSFITDGFTIPSSTAYNSSGNSYVAWNWRGSDSTAVSNTDGTITSTVSANTTSGFSVVTYTGNSTAGSTVGHGLGAKPDVILLKSRSDADNWRGYHSALGATKDIVLNTTSSASTNSSRWNNTEPTSSVFTIGIDDGVNENGDNFVAYCFAEVEGFSKIGSYEGNGSADGPFVYTGFRPAFVLFKNADDSRQWGIVDTSRSTYNQTNATLEPSTSNAENPYDDFDFLSNGFKPRTTDPGSNRSGYTIIYMAFAENPFKNSLAR